MSPNEMRVIAFLSGKGGSGKTTVAISMAKLLSDMGFNCLLIDLDLATNGASYFFQPNFNRNSRGIWDAISRMGSEAATDETSGTTVQYRPCILKISEKLGFVASRVRFGTKGRAYDEFAYDKSQLRNNIMLPLLKEARAQTYNYVFIDCQAGSAISCAVAAQLADMAIIVTEADSISSDAAENLVIQMGSRLPRERRYLVNKIDIRDAETYRNMHDVFQSLNRLPPLPFDFSVRNAFGARRIPVDIAEPSPLLFALFETLKYALPEVYSRIQSYRETHVDQLFEDYEAELKHLMEEKEALRQSLAEVEAHSSSMSKKLAVLTTNGLAILVALLGTLSAASMTSWWRKWTENFLESSWWTPIGVLYISMAASALIMFYGRTKQRRKRLDEEQGAIQDKLRTIETKLDGMRSLLWTKSRDYLLDEVVSGNMKRYGCAPQSVNEDVAIEQGNGRSNG